MQKKAAQQRRTPRRFANTMVPWSCCGALALLAQVYVHAAAPTLDAIYPAGGERGSTNVVTFSGKFDPWPPKVWTDVPGLSFRATTNKGKFNLTISADVKAGPRLIRVFNEEGVTDPRIFVIGEGREVSDTETNDHFERAQAVESLPVTINGRLDKSGDVDSFAVALRSGQWLAASVDSHTLMSKLDAVLRLVTTNGHHLAWNHDFTALDPRLIWQSTNDQTVVLQIFGFPHPATSDVRLYGGESAIYRLHLAVRDQPPPGCADDEASDSAINVRTPPFSIKGVIAKPAEEDRFQFSAKQNILLRVDVAAAANGSPLDPWVRIEDANGKQLDHNDDAEGSRDPALEWKAPTNGTFTVVIGSLTHHGGPSYGYALTVEETLPEFRARLTASSMLVTADSTNSLKLNVKRLRGHTNELLVNVVGLPQGMTAIATNVPSGGGDINVPLIASANPPPFQGPVDVIVTDAVSKQEQRAVFPLTSRTEDNGVPGGYSKLLVDSIDHLWITMRPKSEEPAKTTAAAK